MFPRQVRRERVRALVDLLSHQSRPNLDNDPFDGLDELALLLPLKGFEPLTAARLCFTLMTVVTSDD
jgi:hypothetical protein